MALREIDYQGFRNLVNARLEFVEDFNFIIGENGSGKTNLLEAICYVSLASSFRAQEERSLIHFGDQFLKIDAKANGKKAVIYLDRDKKRLMLQGNEIHRLSDFIGWLDVTILSIEDIWIVRGAPVKRRYYLDWVISKISPTYLSNLIEYRKILRQRNKVLQLVNDNGDTSLLDLFDEQLINYGNELYKVREENLPELKNNVAQFSAELGLNKVDIDYQSSCPDMRLNSNVLEEVRQKEVAFGQTVVGPHRDDLLFMVDGHPLKYYASEGEERAVAIALKLAEAEILYNKKGTRPILLLDEVSAELDQNRKVVLLNLLKGQIFYASTQMPECAWIYQQKKYNIFKVKRGGIEVSGAN